MPFRLTVSGIPVECDSAQEAAELLRFAGLNCVGEKARTTPASTVATGPSGLGRQIDLDAAMSRLGDESKSVLRALTKSSGPLMTADLAAHSNVAADRLKYSIRGIQMLFEKIGLNPTTAINSERSYVGGKPKSKYWLSEAAKKALEGMK